ncbi:MULTISPECIES: RloB family protein [Empedobacter]|uniref:RloB family protein n=2 Tax=Weeksellaceae TaxID=2762318 RepID=UPI00056DB452|nr:MULTISPECIES: RloB family protein [Empedobacter]MBY0066503.1 RloB family protein [Empedobacter falsenii]MDM1139202.1 RloB domain-containing protein [Empedobacter sp. R132-2]
MPKPTRAVKKTDKNKAWNRKAKPSSYQIETIPIRKSILIVCEGQTEKLYFESFPVLGLKVEAVDLGGQSKTKLVDSTQKIIESSEYEYDEVWCVFDMDFKNGADEYADFDNAIEKANTLGNEVAYSNDSFELWFYLHYNKIEAQQLRTFYYEQLSQKFGINYEREGKKYAFCQKVYSILLNDEHASQERAIKNADELYESQKHLIYHKQNPVTTVYKLVQTLNENVRK